MTESLELAASVAGEAMFERVRGSHGTRSAAVVCTVVIVAVAAGVLVGVGLAKPSLSKSQSGSSLLGASLSVKFKFNASRQGVNVYNLSSSPCVKRADFTAECDAAISVAGLAPNTCKTGGGYFPLDYIGYPKSTVFYFVSSNPTFPNWANDCGPGLTAFHVDFWFHVIQAGGNISTTVTIYS